MSGAAEQRSYDERDMRAFARAAVTAFAARLAERGVNRTALAVSSAIFCEQIRTGAWPSEPPTDAAPTSAESGDAGKGGDG